nr:retrovirus-related Pol polyprotein from transposon TNT 1-94 [Tanacetum cinerariifolium]
MQNGRVVVQNVQGRQNRVQGNNTRVTVAPRNRGALYKAGNVTVGQGKLIKCYKCNGIGHIARNYNQLKGSLNSDYFKNKILLIKALENEVDKGPVQDMAQNEDNIFQADQCDAFDSDVDEAPTAQTMFMTNLSSADPVYDETGPSYDSDTLSEIFWSDDLLKMKAKTLKEKAKLAKPITAMIVNLKEQLQGRGNTIREFKDKISRLKKKHSEVDPILDFKALDSQNKYLNAKVNALQDLNESLRAKNEKVKQHYKELYDSIKLTRAKTIEKTTSLLIEIETLKAQIKWKTKCVTMPDLVQPKVLAPGMYAIDVELIPPQIGTIGKFI